MDAPAINADKTRSTDSIARDIIRRLLPPYDDLWQSSQAAMKARRDALDMADHIERLLIVAVPGSHLSHGRNSRAHELRRIVEFGDNSKPTGRGTVTYSGYADQRIDIVLNNLQLDFAIKLLHVLKQETEIYGQQARDSSA